MTVTAEQVLDTLRRVKGPDLEGNIVDLGLVSGVVVRANRAYFSITIPAARAEELEPLRQAAEKVAGAIPGLAGATAVLTADVEAGRGGQRPPASARVEAARATAAAARPSPAPGGTAGQQRMRVPGIRHLIAIASGKGGVGKSTTAVNVALGLRALGLAVGILDADIYGPSQPRLLGLTGRPKARPDKKLEPMTAYGLEVMSMGFLVDEGTPVIWRGPMVVSALTQMLREVAWGTVAAKRGGELDVLVIDMPPGTGDVQLTMAQQVPLSGAVIVSTPQDLALIDARKGLAMFQKVEVPVLGIVENMSLFICPSCGARHDIFGHGGAEAEAVRLGVPFLGAVPLDIAIRVRSDAGQPITVAEPDGVHAETFRLIASRLWDGLERDEGRRLEPPTLSIADNGAALSVAFTGKPAFVLQAEMLRVMSPSAEVQGHSATQRVTVGNKRNVKIRSLSPVGNYAVRIAFDDGHDTGLFTWSYLAELDRDRADRWDAYLAELAAKGLSRG